jgi:hypothetical protein
VCREGGRGPASGGADDDRAGEEDGGDHRADREEGGGADLGLRLEPAEGDAGVGGLLGHGAEIRSRRQPAQWSRAASGGGTLVGGVGGQIEVPRHRLGIMPGEEQAQRLLPGARRSHVERPIGAMAGGGMRVRGGVTPKCLRVRVGVAALR